MVTFQLELDIEFPSPFYFFMLCSYGLGDLWNLLAISEWKLLQSKSYTIFFQYNTGKSKYKTLFGVVLCARNNSVLF